MLKISDLRPGDILTDGREVIAVSHPRYDATGFTFLKLRAEDGAVTTVKVRASLSVMALTHPVQEVTA